MHRQRRRRRRRVAALALGGAVALGVGLAAGQPSLAWHLRPSDNRLHLRLVAGAGPLAAWVLGQSGLQLTGMDAPAAAAVRQLRPGQRTRLRVRLMGLASRTVTVRVTVPAAPALRQRRLAARALQLRFDLPLDLARAASGRGPAASVAASGRAVLLARTARPQVVRLEVVAVDGEETAMAVTVPALPAIGWRAGPARLAGRAPLTVRFDRPMRWSPRPRGLQLTPTVRGRWRTVGRTALRFVPSGRWPDRARLTVRLPAATLLMGVDGAEAVVGARSLRLPRPTAPATVGRHRRVPGTAPRLPRPLPPSGPTLPVYSFGSPAGGRIYLTIDDGWFPSLGVLRLMRRDHLPITAFLIADAAQAHLSFWRAFVAAGGVIEDHTVSHPDLNRLTPAGARLQWAVNRDRVRRWFGAAPTLGRPPYGDADRSVLAAARSAGLRAIALWSVVDTGGHIQTWNGAPLEAGEIVLLHWDPGLATDLRRLLVLVRARHLTPAPLLAGLP